MKILLSYVPDAYCFMPHLAIHYLKGFINERFPDWSTRAHDLNLEWHNYLWAPHTADELIEGWDPAENRELILLGEFISQHAARSVELLRTPSSYDDRHTISDCMYVLQQTKRFVSLVDDKMGVPRDQWPSDYGQWPQLIESVKNSVVAKFLQHQVDSGHFDDFDVVGISIAYREQILPAQILARALKLRHPQMPIIMGGAGLTHIERYVAKDPSFFAYVDYGVMYEGEYPLEQILKKLSGQPHDPIINTVQVKEGKIQYQLDLHGLPKTAATPDFSDLDDLYPSPEVIYPLLTSKGCYWGKCSFCTHHESYGKGYYPLPTYNLDKALTKLVNDGARAFYFVDEALPMTKVAQLATLFEQLGIPDRHNIKWIAEARCEKKVSTREFAGALKRSGCRLLVNGIESGSTETLALMRKGIDLGTVSRFSKECRELGIRVGWMFFIGHPGETESQQKETFRFIDANSESVDYVSIGTFSLEAGSPIWSDPATFGIEEIEGVNEPYRLDYPFKLSGQSRLQGKRTKLPVLSELLREFPHIKPKITSAVDRAFALFLNDSREVERVSPSNLRTKWHSPRLERNVEFDFDTRSFKLTRDINK